MSKPQHVIIGGLSKAGKSEAAKALPDYQVIKFADPLKDIICKVLGISRAELEATKDKPRHIVIGGKELAIINHMLGFRVVPWERLYEKTFKNIREAMRYIGTDVIRAIDPDWHVRKFTERIKPGVSYKADDARFQNELDVWPDALTIYIVNPTVEPADHASENSLGPDAFQFVVTNDGTIADLHERIREVVNRQ